MDKFNVQWKKIEIATHSPNNCKLTPRSRIFKPNLPWSWATPYRICKCKRMTRYNLTSFEQSKTLTYLYTHDAIAGVKLDLWWIAKLWKGYRCFTEELHSFFPAGNIMDTFNLYWLTLIPVWLSNYVHFKVWKECLNNKWFPLSGMLKILYLKRLFSFLKLNISFEKGLKISWLKLFFSLDINVRSGNK